MKGICFKELLFHSTIEGRKTQTRRIMAPQPPAGAHLRNVSDELLSDRKTWKRRAHFSNGTEASPKYSVGDVVYLKEPYARSYIPEVGDRYDNPLQAACDPKCWETIYKFDGKIYYGDDGPVEWENKLFMPASAARYFIRITDIEEERLQDISEEDCIREGIIKKRDSIFDCDAYDWRSDSNVNYGTAVASYASLIDFINGRGTWDSNPWVWVYDYELCETINRPQM
jgi:hypothetical protein